MISVAAHLDTAIRAVCPIIGVSIGRIDDKATWRVDFAPEATQAQRTAAQTLVDGFDVAAVEEAETAKVAAIDALALSAHANAVFTALRNATAADISAHVNTTFPTLTVAQRNDLKLLLVVAAAVLRKGVI